MRMPSVLSLTSLIVTGALAAQQAGPAPVSLETIRKAVVTVHALDAGGEAVASGTGFFVIPSGLVVTAAHVLEGAAGCSIEMSDGQTLRCSATASDTAKDVLMLTVSGAPPAMLRWGSSDAAHDGDEIRVVSNPLGQLPGTLSKGIISASRVVDGTKLLQISAPISHGSSGAPLLNARGEVIGVIRSTIEAGQALNFATATDAVRNMQNDPVAVNEAQGLLRKPALAARTMEPATPTATGTGRDLAVGQSVDGELTSGDELYSDTTYYQFWHLTARTGQTVTVDLTSSDFDPYLIVRGAADTSLTNDDGGPGCAARIVFTARGSGPFTILVNTTNSPIRQTGRFTLAATARALPVDSPDTRDCHPGGQLPAAGDLHAISIGQSVTGRLTTGDPLYPDTTYYQRWQFSAQPNQDITIDLASSDFDPVLIVRGAADTSLINDNGGPGCASRVVFTAPGSGPITILVNTTDRPARQTGGFTLSVSPGRKPDLSDEGGCAAVPPSGGGLHTISVGQTMTGQLTTDDPLYPDTTYYQRWQFTARPGQDITVDLASTDFDPVLLVYGAGDNSLVNDDGGPGCDSRVVFTAPSTGPFTILVNTTTTPTQQTGRFTLSVTPGSKPVDPRATRDSPGDCRPSQD